MARRLSPGRALVAVGAGHTAWGLVAYRRPLRDIVRAGVRDTVGDGLIRKAHADDGRAAAFWFLFAGPMTSSLGYMLERADRSGDRTALHAAAATLAALGLTGTAMIPRAPFPVAVAIAAWIEGRLRAA